MLVDLPEGEGDEEIILHPEAFGNMKGLRIFINRNARFSCAPNYLSEELRVLDWSQYPVESLPLNFKGENLIVFKIHDSLVKELGDGFKPKNLTTMTFRACEFLKKIPNLSSTPNLKELIATYCTRLVEVHDSVGSLENLSILEFEGCSELHILPRSLNSRSLCDLNLNCCSSLRYLPEIECKMECLRELILRDTAIEELPLSIGNLVGLEHLCLWDCKNLMRLPSACIQLQHLQVLVLSGCPNLGKKMGNDGLSLLAIESTKMEEEISLREETNFFPISSVFTLFNSTSLVLLDLLDTEIVSLPTSFKEFVELESLSLQNCEKLEEILELPPNIRNVDVDGCKSLERFPEVSKILEFNGSHIRSLESITLHGCNKMHMNIWNDKVQNPLLWKGVSEYDATLFPKNQIPEWLSYVHEFLKDDDEGLDGRRKKEEWVIDIEGPHYLEEISGIVLYAVMFFKDDQGYFKCYAADITSNGSNVKCYSEGVGLVDLNPYRKVNMPGYVVWVGYSNLQSFERKVLDNLRVRFLLYSENKKKKGFGYVQKVPFYKSCRARVVYKNERRANKKRKIHEETTKLVKLPKKEKEK